MRSCRRSAPGPAAHAGPRGLLILVAGAVFLLCGCVRRVYDPGPSDSPFQQLRLGQSYREMTRVLGEPDSSRAEDRMGGELAILLIPVWDLFECIWNFRPSATQVYTYDRWGTVTLGDENRILCVEASQSASGQAPRRE